MKRSYLKHTTDHSAVYLPLDKYQMFDFIRGAWCSASRDTETLELFVNRYLYSLTPEMTDFLWAMVYRDLYLPSSASSPRGGQEGAALLHFLAAFNTRNWSRIVVQHHDGSLRGILCYSFQGTYYIINHPDRAIQATITPWTSFIPEDKIIDFFPNREEKNHINSQLALVPHQAYEDLSIYQ